MMWHVNKEVVSPHQTLACGNTCQPDIYDQCGMDRQCFGAPDNCITTKTCTSLLSYGAADPNTATLPVDLYGNPANKYSRAGWIGFGLSMSGAMVGTFSID